MADWEYDEEQIEELLDFDVLVTPFEGGSEQRRKRHPENVIGFRLTSPPLTKSDMQTRRTFFKSKGGALTSFTFLSPFDDVTYTVRFVERSFRTTNARGFYRIQYELKVLT